MSLGQRNELWRRSRLAVTAREREEIRLPNKARTTVVRALARRVPRLPAGLMRSLSRDRCVDRLEVTLCDLCVLRG
jgi:hypothetical protein